jgi:glutamyl-Q tRNA(Asp) synthetase
VTAPAYIGRFAPSPTGPLHFGSLVCALASFLDARHYHGQWLVRIEDIDPPREIPGATATILHQLEAHGLLWDGELLYQSQRMDAYAAALEQLQSTGLLFNCDCNRQRIAELGGIYDGHCRQRVVSGESALRLRVPYSDDGDYPLSSRFNDLIMGCYQQNLRTDVGDFVVRRRDGLISYQLAVTVDDQFQGITHIVRGADLLDSTPRQIYLQHCLGYRDNHRPALHYAHLPLATNDEGQKLSKQNHATALLQGNEADNLWLALDWLQQKPPAELRRESITKILHWAIDNWTLTAIPGRMEIPAPRGF